MEKIQIENFLKDDSNSNDIRNSLSLPYKRRIVNKAVFVLIFLVSTILLVISICLVYNIKQRINVITTERIALDHQLKEEENKITETMRAIQREEKTLQMVFNNNKDLELRLTKLKKQKDSLHEEVTKASNQNYNLWTSNGDIDKKLYGLPD